MKKKHLFLAAITTCALIVTTGIVIGSKTNYKEIANVNATDTYSLVLNKANGMTSAEQTAGNFTRNTTQGNAIAFAHSGQAYEGTGFFQTHANGAYISNTTPINGLRSIKVHSNDPAGNNRTYKILFGNAEGNYFYSSDDIVGNQTVQEYKVPQYETPFEYFKLQATTANWTHFISVEIVYSCSNTLNNRGKTFNGTKGGGYDFTEPVDVATGTINVDIKWTDLGADNGKTAIAFFDQGWAHDFGYKTVKASSKTGDIPGLTVSKLSDGYTRFSWKLSEMTGSGTLPTSVKTVHIRDNADWTTSEGYFDVNSSVSVVEFKGKRFTNDGVNTDLSSSVSLTTGKIQIDLYYTSYGKVTFAAMDDWNGNYYGYFDITPTGNNGSVYGVQVVSQCSGFVRLIFEASKVSASKVNKTPTAINMIYLRGNGGSGYTTAFGYVDITILSN